MVNVYERVSNNSAQYYCFCCIFYQINAAMMSIKDFEKAFLNLYLFIIIVNISNVAVYIGQFVYPIHTENVCPV